AVTHLVFAPDGRTLASCSQDERAWLWEVATGKQIACVPGAKELTFSADGKTLTSGGGPVRLWDARTGEELVYRKGTGSFSTFALSPEGRLLATVGDREVQLWETASGKLLATFPWEGEAPAREGEAPAEPRASGPISRLEFGGDGKTLTVHGS